LRASGSRTSWTSGCDVATSVAQDRRGARACSPAALPSGKPK
jgi:hypothetical protein